MFKTSIGKKQQDSNSANFYVYIVDQITEINKIFLEKDVTRLSGVWKEQSDDLWLEARVEIQKL